MQVHQVHRNRVHVVDRHSRGITAVADGMVTAAPNMILAILTADCVPILLFDADAGVAGALHAGWRGVIADIVSAGISAMASIGARPERIRAALGPAIGACCFEVDIELARRFEAEIADARRHVRQASDEKAFIDLKGLVRDQLVREGLAAGADHGRRDLHPMLERPVLLAPVRQRRRYRLAVKFYRDAGVILGYGRDAKDQGAIKGDQYQGAAGKGSQAACAPVSRPQRPEKIQTRPCAIAGGG